MIIGYKNYIGDDRIKNGVLNKVFENELKANKISEKDEIFENSSISRFIKSLIDNTLESQSNKYLLLI